MSVETKRKEILQMLSKGAITAAEASELLDQVQVEEASTPPPQGDAPPLEKQDSVLENSSQSSGKKARWLNILITNTASDQRKVSVRLPLSLARLGIRIGTKFAPEMDDIDWDDILSEISSGEIGNLVEVADEVDQELVQVFVS